MKKLTQFALTLLCLFLPMMLHAQDENSKYLAGAVPEVNGRVVFTKEFSIPGMSEEEIYERALKWMDTRLKENENNSRVVLSDKEKGLIVGTGEEWMVFTSSALSLDRTKVLYQLMVTCQPEKCKLEIDKIRYNYREGQEKYTAEEWITDKYALNKAKTKLVRGLAKWRKKTVDFADNLGLSMAESLSSADMAQTATAEKEAEQAAEKKADNSGPMVIIPKKQVIEKAPGVETATVTPNAPAQAPKYKEIDPENLPADAIQTGTGKLVIVIGEEPFNMTMMTANSGGSLGKVNGKSVVFSILSADQPYEQMEKAENYVIRFYPTGQQEPTVILECKKLPSPAAMEGMPRTYVGEILKATIKGL